MQKIQEFWSNSYHSDRVAFYLELVSFVFTVGASMYLALNANSPDMRYVYPGFLVGALTQSYASWRRGSAWVMLLTAYFSCINVFGFGRAVGWW